MLQVQGTQVVKATNCSLKESYLSSSALVSERVHLVEPQVLLERVSAEVVAVVVAVVVDK